MWKMEGGREKPEVPWSLGCSDGPGSAWAPEDIWEIRREKKSWERERRRRGGGRERGSGKGEGRGGRERGEGRGGEERDFIFVGIKARGFPFDAALLLG